MLYACPTQMLAADIALAAYHFKLQEFREFPPPLLDTQSVRLCGKVYTSVALVKVQQQNLIEDVKELTKEVSKEVENYCMIPTISLKEKVMQQKAKIQ